MATIEQILKGREIVDTYRTEQSQPGAPDTSAQLLKDVQALGFEGIGEFFEASTQAVKEDMTRCIELVGECDRCIGRTPGCVKSCYDQHSQVDPTSPTGRTPLKAEKEKDVVSVVQYFKDFFKSLPPRKKGRVTPMLPNCSIEVHIIEDPVIDWDWI